MRRRTLLQAMAATSALLVTQAVAGSSSPIPSGCQPGWTVVAHSPTGKRLAKPNLVACVVSTGYATSEPSLAITPRGTVVVSPAQSENSSARSTDGGRTWQLTQPGAQQYTSLWNTVDPNLTVDRTTGRLYLVHATGPTRTTPILVDESPLPSAASTAIAGAYGFQVYSSGDEGRTWTTADYQTSPMTDWEKVFVGPARTGSGSVVYVCGNSPFEAAGPGRLCYRSHDQGATFTLAGYIFPSTSQRGECPVLAANNGTVGPDGTVYQPVSCSDGSYVAVSKDEGATYTWFPVPGPTGTGFAFFGQRFQIASDASGTLYASWVDGDHLWLASSRDGAHTWGAAMDVAVPGAHAIALSQLAAGPAGHVGLAYYAASQPRASTLTAWMTQTADGKAFISAALSDPRHPTYTDFGLSGPNPRADYIGAAFDRQGRLWAAMVRQGARSADGASIATLGTIGHLERLASGH